MTENSAYLREQIITYIGNKRALLPFILEAVEAVKGELGREKLALCDLFSGSGIVARGMKAHAASLFVNDLEKYSLTLNRCYLSNSTDRDMSALEQAWAGLKTILSGPLEPGFLSRLYAPENENHIRPGERVFYTPRNARYLDTARQAIGKLPQALQPYFLAPLLAEASVKTNTAGVFKGFYKDSRTGVGRYGGRGQNALSRICAEIDLPFPLFSRFDCPVTLFQEDANTLASRLPPMDLVYLDPPYNQHPYGSNYFMLNLINDYTEPTGLSPVSGIPTGWNRSPYNRRREALDRLGELCDRLDSRYLLISFNSEGFIPREELEAMLKRIGPTTVMEKQYNAFRGSRNLRSRATYTKEYLFLVRKQGGLPCNTTACSK